MTDKLMTLLGLALGPVTIVILDLVFTQPSVGGVFEDIQEFVRSTAVVAWPVGVLIGHWYYPGTLSPVVPRAWNYLVLGGVSVIVIAATIPLGGVSVASNFVSTIALLAGLVAGALLWSMG